MTIHYSASTGGFYDSDIHGKSIPSDAEEITEQEHIELLNGQSAGKRIAPDEKGRPSLQEQTSSTQAEVRAAKVALVQEHMDAAARALRYESISNAITYAEEPTVPKFQNEGIAFRAWRSLVWARCYEILAEVESGARGIPSDDELIAALPDLKLPA